MTALKYRGLQELLRTGKLISSSKPVKNAEKRLHLKISWLIFPKKPDCQKIFMIFAVIAVHDW